MGRTAAGVKGITLRGDDDSVVSMDIIDEGVDILNVTEKGFGKRTPESEYRITNRGGKGILTSKITDKTGQMVSAKPVTGEEDIMIITVSGVLIRMPVSSISSTGRNTQGVILIRIQENEAVATVARIDKEQEEEIEDVSDDMLEEPVVSETDNTEED